MWANFHLLFWLSLIPFATAWAGEHALLPWPTATYGLILLACALARYVMQVTIVRAQGTGSTLAQAIGGDWKGKLSPFLYAAGIALAFVRPMLADAIFTGVALLWLVPDRRIHRALNGQQSDSE